MNPRKDSTAQILSKTATPPSYTYSVEVVNDKELLVSSLEVASDDVRLQRQDDLMPISLSPKNYPIAEPVQPYESAQQKRQIFDCCRLM